MIIFSLQKVLQNKFIRLFSLKGNTHPFLIGCFLISFFIVDLSKAESNNSNFKKIDHTKTEYLESKKELEDYIIDSGDVLYIDFYPAKEFNNNYKVNAEGEILLPRIDETYVRGLTTSELQQLLVKRYLEFLVDPEIKVRISEFKSLRVLVRGEVRNPGLYKFPSYRPDPLNLSSNKENDNDNNNNSTDYEIMDKTYRDNKVESKFYQLSNNSINIKRTSENIFTISDVIRKAGGITSSTDLSRIEIIRDVPLGKGGGKKRAIIDLNSFVNQFDDSNDLRIFDGDNIFLPKLNQNSAKQIPQSVLSGLSPKYITVDIFGRVENPGTVKLPLEASLSDAINLTGPIKPLSGKIVLIRYNEDGSVLNKNISYSSRAKKGSKNNPYVKQDDLISVKNSFFGKSTDTIREFTAPFIGIYTFRELIEKF